MGDLTIYGDCDPRFERVRGALVENFQRRGEVGAAVSVMVDGHCAVDLWAGHADHAQLDFEAPVAKYWPEFAQAGKGMIPVSYLLNHKAGLAAIRAPLRDEELLSWEKVTTELARQEPWWEPGTKHGYHAITFGWLVGEVVRRISGKSLGTYFRDEIAGPLKADAYIGFDASLDPRVADTISAPPPTPGEPNVFAEMLKDPESVSAKAITNPPSLMLPTTTNSRAWRGAEIPAANGHAT